MPFLNVQYLRALGQAALAGENDRVQWLLDAGQDAFFAQRSADNCFDEEECHSFLPEVGPQTTQNVMPEFNDVELDDVGYRWERGQRYRNSSVTHRVAQRLFADISPEIPLNLEGGLRVAMTLAEMETGLNPKVIQRGGSCSVRKIRVNPKQLRYSFGVDCSGNERVVKLKVIPTSRRARFQLTSADLRASCSCPAWVWWGSEWAAKNQQYLDQKLRGSGTPPDIRDPQRINHVCKHVYAVLNNVRDWTLTHPDHR